jgi:hypothetical protein
MTGSAPGATGSGLLARVQFEALTAGTATITPLNMMFLDSANLAQLNASGTSTDVVINQQTTNPVPEPGSWLLLTTAGALAAFRLRRRTRHPVV